MKLKDFKKVFFIFQNFLCRRPSKRAFIQQIFLATLFRIGYFYPQLTLRYLIQPDLESPFVVGYQLAPSMQSDPSPCAELQVVKQSTHLSKDCYLPLVLNPHRFKIGFHYQGCIEARRLIKEYFREITVMCLIRRGFQEKNQLLLVFFIYKIKIRWNVLVLLRGQPILVICGI